MEQVYPPASEVVQEVKKKLTHREEIELKKQTLKEQEEAECTFKPKLTSKTTPFKGLPKTSVSLNSPNPVELTKISGEVANEVVEKAVTVSPAVPAKHNGRVNKKQEVVEKSVSSTTPVKVTSESINRLYSGVGSGHSKQTVVEPEEVKSKKLHSADLDLTVQRLFSEADKLKAKTEQMRLEVENSKLSQCTFKPQINKVKSTKDKVSASTIENQAIENASTEPYATLAAAESNLLALTQRMEKFAAEKARKLEEARKAKEEEELKGCSFSPALNKRNPSNSAVQQKRSGTPTRERGNGSSEGVPVTVFKRPVSVPEKPTFKPQLVTNYPTTNKSNGEGMNVHDRLFQTGVMSRKEQEAAVSI